MGSLLRTFFVATSVIGIVACGASGRNHRTGPEPGFEQAVRVALLALPVDSLCDVLSCRVVAFDPRVRRAELIGASSPRLPDALRMNQASLPATLSGRKVLLSGFMDQLREDTLSVLAAIVHSEQSPGDLTVTFLLRGPSQQWDRACVIFLREHHGMWVVEKRQIMEG